MPNNFLALVRHGQSEWNKKNLFAGWTDVDLSAEGEREAIRAGQALKRKGLVFDLAFSSALKRAIRTMEIVLERMGLADIPRAKAWQLNERHYGALQGQNRQAVIDKYGARQAHQWRRGFDTAPPLLKAGQTFKKTGLYKGLKSAPRGESLKDTQRRVLPYWKKTLLPRIQEGQSIALFAHGNSLRALIKELEHISDRDIAFVEIKTGQPLIYKLDSRGGLLSKEILKT